MKDILCGFITTVIMISMCAGVIFTVYASEPVSFASAEDYVPKSGSDKTENSSLSFEGNKVVAEARLEKGTAATLSMQVTYIYQNEVTGQYQIDMDIVKAEGRQGFVKAEFEKENSYVVCVVMETEVLGTADIKPLKEVLSAGDMRYIGEFGNEGEVQQSAEGMTPTPVKKGSATPTPVSQENEVSIGTQTTEDGFRYREDKNQMQIYGYEGEASVVQMPGLIDERQVKSIDAQTFKGKDFIVEIIFPEGVTSIGEEVCAEAEGLTKITLPDSIECIGTGVFERCMNLKKVVLSANIKNIGMRAFDNCRNLEEIIFKEGSLVEEIGDGAFAGCRALKSIELPEGLETIGGALFYRCESLDSIKIPDGVTEIGVMAFSRCTALTKVEIPASVTTIADSAFHECKNVTIYGTEGSAAQEYAVSHGIPFESME